ncbi:MAG: hypothetical protein ACP5SI_00165 [Chloroflexia bacterium]
MAEEFQEVRRETIPVTIYTAFWIARGTIQRLAPIRLSDHVNIEGEEFLELHEPRFMDLSKRSLEMVPEPGPWFIHRGQILIIHEVPSAAGPSEPRPAPPAVLRIPKYPKPVRLVLDPFRVEGNVFLPEYGQLAAYIGRANVPFLPLTAATITMPSWQDLGVISVPFALVNWQRLAIGPGAA